MESWAEERSLWRRALEHDERAFAAIFDLHRDRVFRHVLRLAASPHDAEEIASASFFELWRKRSSVRVVDGSVLPWLLVTASNLARNSQRSLKRYRALFDSFPRLGADPVIPSAPVGESSELRDVLARLDRRDSALLVLTALEGYSIAQAAELIGVSPGAARTRLHRTRRRLQVELQQAGFGTLGLETDS